MKEIREFIKEALGSITKRASDNQINGNFFGSLCDMLKLLKIIAEENLTENDELFKEIENLKKIICKN